MLVRKPGFLGRRYRRKQKRFSLLSSREKRWCVDGPVGQYVVQLSGCFLSASCAMTSPPVKGPSVSYWSTICHRRSLAEAFHGAHTPALQPIRLSQTGPSHAGVEVYMPSSTSRILASRRNQGHSFRIDLPRESGSKMEDEAMFSSAAPQLCLHDTRQFIAVRLPTTEEILLRWRRKCSFILPGSYVCENKNAARSFLVASVVV